MWEGFLRGDINQITEVRVMEEVARERGYEGV